MRVLAGMGAQWNAASSLTVSGGVEGFVDHAWLNDTRLLGAQTTFGDANQITYGNLAAWAFLRAAAPISGTC